MLNQDQKEVTERIERRIKAEEVRSEIKQKVKMRIEEIINSEIEKVRKPKETLVAKLPQFDELSSMN